MIFFRLMVGASVAIILATVVAIGGDATGWRTPYPSISIGDDGGGMVDDYVKFYNNIRNSRVPVRIEGACVSACTLVLSLPKEQVCVLPTAKFGFHLASVNNVPDPRITAELVDRYYPPVVIQWIKDHGPLVPAPIYMTGAEAIKLGIVRGC